MSFLPEPASSLRSLCDNPSGLLSRFSAQRIEGCGRIFSMWKGGNYARIGVLE